MTKAFKSSALETVTGRFKLAPRTKPYWLLRLSPGLTLGYRRTNGPVGTWNVRIIKGRKASIKVLGPANDREEADGKRVLSFEQAQHAARKFAFGDVQEANLDTLEEVLTAYEVDLKARDAYTMNATWVRNKLKKSNPALLAKPVRMITAKELKDWRNNLAKGDKGMTAVTWNRMSEAFRAALQLAAPDRFETWKAGLEKRPDNRQDRARNVVLDDEEVRAVVGAAYQAEAPLGLLIEVLAVTGTRPSQA